MCVTIVCLVFRVFIDYVSISISMLWCLADSMVPALQAAVCCVSMLVVFPYRACRHQRHSHDINDPLIDDYISPSPFLICCQQHGVTVCFRCMSFRIARIMPFCTGCQDGSRTALWRPHHQHCGDADPPDVPRPRLQLERMLERLGLAC